MGDDLVRSARREEAVEELVEEMAALDEQPSAWREVEVVDRYMEPLFGGSSQLACETLFESIGRFSVHQVVAEIDRIPDRYNGRQWLARNPASRLRLARHRRLNGQDFARAFSEARHRPGSEPCATARSTPRQRPGTPLRGQRERARPDRGDIHGCFDKLQARLDAVGFDPGAGDRLFSVGDLVDRGPQSDAVLDWLEKPWFHPVLGNHEQMALLCTVGEQDEDEYRANGGEWFLRSSPTRRDQIARRLAACRWPSSSGPRWGRWASCMPTARPRSGQTSPRRSSRTPTRELREGLVESALWSRDRCLAWCEDEVEGVRAVVVGHTAMTRWMTLGNVIYIDTDAWMADEARDFCLLDAASLRPVNGQPPFPRIPHA